MRNILAIAKRELNMYFVSPIAYLVAVALYVILSIVLAIFWLIATGSGYGQTPTPVDVLSTYFTLFVLIGASAALTMRLFSEEQRAGTLELLMTAPVREAEVVLGKWLAALGLIFIIFVPTLLYALILNYYTTPGIDWKALAAAYIGLLLMSGAMLAIGVFASSLFANQIAAFFVTLVVEVALWLFTYVAQFMSNNVSGPVADVVSHLAFFDHYYNSFNSGAMYLTDIVFYLSVIAIFLFMAVRMVESRRWR